ERLDYNRLYAEALADPTLRRTEEELEVALSNATGARRAVTELFQDLDRFDLSDYTAVEDDGRAMDRLFQFVRDAAEAAGRPLRCAAPEVWEADGVEGIIRFTTSREAAGTEKGLPLLGLDLP